MTGHDWAGLLVTVVAFVVMAIAYFQVFRPGNKEKLESHRFMVLDDEIINSGEKNER
jgi:cytochrome c oxidase cbb3-type subunit 4